MLIFPYIQSFLLKGFQDFWLYLNNEEIEEKQDRL